ncbi:signal transduction histidine kinase [Nonomuraea fuscirosea]|uniref:Sensor-like histidine kinase SenX3 n=1 Tax=Nonomuraea fuscirosea TaxID=1291556 RepID=A0A2T0MNS4_9ACTN|nr:HAMP domain-containing sensor histidine kinase [Nonomuraea fuscirosea]PRX59639.1 signal transduction histidine kinase [Nonomuraea fuscirosea]
MAVRTARRRHRPELTRRARGPARADGARPGEALARQRRFAADVSHELRSPLTRLHTRAQLLSRRIRGGTDPILLIDEVDQLVDGTRQLGEVVENLLRAARFKQLRGPFGPVDLAVLAAELAAAENARATLRLWITLSGGRDAVLLTVRDDGAGLDPRDAERLFTRFEGARFGLGLALVREVVDGHDGTITADGRPGGGATFTVRLPAHRPAAAGGPEPAWHRYHPPLPG